jgi:2,3-bisphosphoglycerate-independent phosphoglycerate mutase
MRLLFLFFDGIGLGSNDPANNPFAAADLPTLSQFTAGRHWLDDLTRIETERAIFIPTDACLGVDGKPQSGTGQAAIMTGLNVPEMIGRHYGPKPNEEIAAIVRTQGVVRRLTECGYTAAMLNAYPSEFVASIARGKRLLSSMQLAMHSAGVPMRDGSDLLKKRALSVDFTGEMWRLHAANNDAATTIWRARPNSPDTPVMSPVEAGQLTARLALEQDFTFVDCWLTDYIGHRGTLEQGVELLQTIDGVIQGLIEIWDDSEGLILITSDHGNLESIDERGHTRSAVPTVIIGDGRHTFAEDLTSLTHIAPAILRLFSVIGPDYRV